MARRRWNTILYLWFCLTAIPQNKQILNDYCVPIIFIIIRILIPDILLRMDNCTCKNNLSDPINNSQIV